MRHALAIAARDRKGRDETHKVSEPGMDALFPTVNFPTGEVSEREGGGILLLL